MDPVSWVRPIISTSTSRDKKRKEKESVWSLRGHGRLNDVRLLPRSASSPISVAKLPSISALYNVKNPESRRIMVVISDALKARRLTIVPGRVLT